VVTLAPTGYVDHVLSTQIAAGLCIGYLECSAATGILIPNVPSNHVGRCTLPITAFLLSFT
jgi:hypothetical protein